MKNQGDIPTWVHYLNIIMGFCLVILSVIVILNLGLAKMTMILILAVSLIAICFTRIINSLKDEHLSSNFRAANAFVGALGLSIAAVAILPHDIEITTSIFFLAIGLGLQGVIRIAIGSSDRTLSNWLRGFLVSVGILTILLTIIVLLFSNIDEMILIVVLAFTFLINGLARIAKGLAGKNLSQRNST
ncbi:MAG: DUF308 domain-containing protein [Candidatus Hodarchaeota archaeon]